MEHTIKQVETKELNDESVSIHFRCCEDESTDSWCTVALSLTANELAEACNGHKTRMAQHHDQKLQFRAKTHPVSQAAADSTVKV